jgi:hypothetical protein
MGFLTLEDFEGEFGRWNITWVEHTVSPLR